FFAERRLPRAAAVLDWPSPFYHGAPSSACQKVAPSRTRFPPAAPEFFLFLNSRLPGRGDGSPGGHCPCQLVCLRCRLPSSANSYTSESWGTVLLVVSDAQF